MKTISSHLKGQCKAVYVLVVLVKVVIHPPYRALSRKAVLQKRNSAAWYTCLMASRHALCIMLLYLWLIEFLHVTAKKEKMTHELYVFMIILSIAPNYREFQSISSKLTLHKIPVGVTKNYFTLSRRTNPGTIVMDTFITGTREGL